MVLGGAKSKSPHVAAEFATTPPEVLARADQIAPVTAGGLRNLVKTAVADRFGAKPENVGGGDWLYRGTCHGVAFLLSIDYGGRDQFRYEVSYTEPATGIQAQRLNYERILGCGGTGWDFITADNAAASVDLMCTFVERLVRIPERACPLSGRGG